jgi:hypothetical protein
VLAIDVENCLSFTDSRSCKFGINVGATGDITTNECKLNAVSTSKLRLGLVLGLRVGFDLLVLVHLRGYSLVVVMLVRVLDVNFRLLHSLHRIRLSEVLLMKLLGRRLALEAKLVSKESLATVEQGLARLDHGLVECELLAVQNKSSPALLDVLLEHMALAEEAVEAAGRAGVGFARRSQLSFRLVQVVDDFASVRHIDGAEVFEISTDDLDRLLERFESYHHLSFDSDAGLVSRLIEDGSVVIEVINLLVEVGARKHILVILGVVGQPVLWVLEVARVDIATGLS